jgi:hypothetical protein
LVKVELADELTSWSSGKPSAREGGKAMKISGSMILKLLEAEPERYILHDRDEGIDRLKKANGDDVTVSENGKVFPVHPP